MTPLPITLDTDTPITIHSTRPTRETSAELDVWKTNISLSDDTQIRIRALLRYAEEDIDLLDRTILSSLRSSAQEVVELFEHRKECVARATFLRAAASPLRKVPSEILGKIFTFFTQGRIIIPPKLASNPWTLGHVSSRWRRVFLSTPEVWGTIEVVTPTGHIVENLIKTRNIIRDIINRGGGKFNVVVHDHTITPVTDIILPVSCRLETLTIHNLPYEIFCSLLELPVGSLYLLEELNLELYRDASAISSPYAYSTSSLQTAHNLKRVTIAFGRSAYVGHFLPPILLLPWSQLTHIQFPSIPIPWGAIHSFLMHCTSLLVCQLHIDRDPDATIPSSVTTLQDLEVLLLSQECSIDWDIFFDPLTLPSLKDLTINSGPNQYSSAPLLSPHGISSMILRSDCRLESLSVGGFSGSTVLRPLHPVEGLDIKSVLRVSPTLAILQGLFILPSSILESLSCGELNLPNLYSVLVGVHPGGFWALLDFFDSHIHNHEERRELYYSGKIREAIIWCYRGRGYASAYKHYLRRSPIYDMVGIIFTVRAVGDEATEYDEEEEQEYSDGDEVEGEAEGDSILEEEGVVRTNHETQPFTITASWRLQQYISQLFGRLVG